MGGLAVMVLLFLQLLSLLLLFLFLQLLLCYVVDEVGGGAGSNI